MKAIPSPPIHKVDLEILSVHITPPQQILKFPVLIVYYLGNTAPILRKGTPMSLQLGDVAPDFEADTTHGPIRFHEWKEGSWAVFSRIRKTSLQSALQS